MREHRTERPEEPELERVVKDLRFIPVGKKVPVWSHIDYCLSYGPQEDEESLIKLIETPIKELVQRSREEIHLFASEQNTGESNGSLIMWTALQLHPWLEVMHRHAPEKADKAVRTLFYSAELSLDTTQLRDPTNANTLVDALTCLVEQSTELDVIDEFKQTALFQQLSNNSSQTRLHIRDMQLRAEAQHTGLLIQFVNNSFEHNAVVDPQTVSAAIDAVAHYSPEYLHKIIEPHREFVLRANKIRVIAAERLIGTLTVEQDERHAAALGYIESDILQSTDITAYTNLLKLYKRRDGCISAEKCRLLKDILENKISCYRADIIPSDIVEILHPAAMMLVEEVSDQAFDEICNSPRLVFDESLIERVRQRLASQGRLPEAVAFQQASLPINELTETQLRLASAAFEENEALINLYMAELDRLHSQGKEKRRTICLRSTIDALLTLPDLSYAAHFARELLNRSPSAGAKKILTIIKEYMQQNDLENATDLLCSTLLQKWPLENEALWALDVVAGQPIRHWDRFHPNEMREKFLLFNEN